jgi:hypothetical protein
MARIEELPDDFDESLNLNETPKFQAEDDAVFEEMYNNRFAKKGADKPETNPKTFEEVMQEFSKTPLFMNNLNDAADPGMQNLADPGAVSANAEEYLQMVKTQNLMLSEHCNMRAPKLKLPKASKSKGTKWRRVKCGRTQRNFTRKLLRFSRISRTPIGKKGKIRSQSRRKKKNSKSNVLQTEPYVIWS